MVIAEGTISIRRAGLEDAAAIAALTDAAYARHIPLIGRKPQPMTADYARMVADHSIWLLTVEGRPAGVLVLIDEPESTLIYSVAVRPDFQKQGLGRRLLAWAEGRAIRAGYRSIHLYTNERFADNIRLYQRLGYRETGRELYHGSTLVHIAKRLAADQIA